MTFTLQAKWMKMTLDRWDRKKALGHGAITRIAKRVGKSKQHVSAVVNGGRRDREVEVAVARAIGKPTDEVFPPEASGVGNAA